MLKHLKLFKPRQKKITKYLKIRYQFSLPKSIIFKASIVDFFVKKYAFSHTAVVKVSKRATCVKNLKCSYSLNQALHETTFGRDVH